VRPKYITDEKDEDWDLLATEAAGCEQNGPQDGHQHDLEGCGRAKSDITSWNGREIVANLGEGVWSRGLRDRGRQWRDDVLKETARKWAYVGDTTRARD